MGSEIQREGENMEGKSKVVKAETRRCDYGMRKGANLKLTKDRKDFTTKKGYTLKERLSKEETKN
jgi:hypothetical protein